MSGGASSHYRVTYSMMHVMLPAPPDIMTDRQKTHVKTLAVINYIKLEPWQTFTVICIFVFFSYLQ